jgi:hypothetical protein
MIEAPMPTQIKLDNKLAEFRCLNREFEAAKERCRYLGQWVFKLSGEIMLLRNDLREETGETADGQLKLMEVPHE